MGLSATLNIAQSSLATNAALSSLVSRNIAGVNDPGYSRKIANITTIFGGAGSLVSVSRATDAALFRNLLSSTADAASSTAQANGLDQLEQTVRVGSISQSSSTTTTGNSPATLLGTLSDALQTAASSPSDASAGQAVLIAAKALAGALNAASTTVQSVRAQADTDMAAAVADVNGLLGQFKTVNDAIIKGTVSGSDVTDLTDQRNKLLVSLSNNVGITTTAAADGGMSIYTDSGVTLFQGAPRTVTFTPTTAYAPGAVGGAVTIDGVAVTGASAVMGIKTGGLAGLATLRDTTAVAYGNQLDQIASGLVSTFAESDRTGGGAPTIPGLFTYAGAPAMPIAGQTGLASSIVINANVDPSQGGTLTRLRDGGIGDPGNSAYVSNTSGAASDPTNLNSLLGRLGASQTFNATSGGAASGTLAQYATSSVGWLEASRQTATNTASATSAVAAQTGTALSSSTGVNLDEQLSLMLDLEHSYQASAELVSTVNGMFSALFNAMQ